MFTSLYSYVKAFIWFLLDFVSHFAIRIRSVEEKHTSKNSTTKQQNNVMYKINAKNEGLL